MILPIYVYGHPILRNEAKDVPDDYPALKELVGNMFDTMYHAEGVGLAAPQIGLSLRLIVLDGDPMAKDYAECKGFKRVMVNPVIREFSDEEIIRPGVHISAARCGRQNLRRFHCVPFRTRRYIPLVPGSPLELSRVCPAD